MNAAVLLDNVTLSYNRHPAVHHVSGEFAAGSLTAITGPNGAGKSTLLKGIAGILRSDQGSIRVNGSMAYLPQAAQLDRGFPLSVLQMVVTGAWGKTGGMGAISEDLQVKAMAALETVGLMGIGERTLEGLSAGQFQRALFARLLIQDASVLLLDEPFAAIDDETSAKLIEIILGWHKEGRTVICVLHDFNQIKRSFPQCLLLARHCVAWGESGKTLSAENLSHAGIRHAWPQNPEPCPQ